MGCRHSPYTLLGCNGALCSRWGWAGILTAGGHGTFWRRSAGPGHCSAGGGGFLASEGVLGAGRGTGAGIQGGLG